MNSDLSVVALQPTPCVSSTLLREIHAWKECGASDEDVIGRLRIRCVPTGYIPHPWSNGSYTTLILLHTCITYSTERDVETKEDKLRSVLAQIEFNYQVLLYEEQGIPFRTHLYVPEVHPVSGQEYHEREDDAHVLKVHAST